MHGDVRAALLDAYATLAAARPDDCYVYGETGWPEGGRFRPHRTHRNGMAVDFFVPVTDADAAPHCLGTHALNRWGYDIEFDADGRSGSDRIDFAAMAAHLHALADAAAANGLRIDTVIFDPALHRALFAAPGGDRLRGRMRFSPRQAWVRHDEHYHVVFAPR